MREGSKNIKLRWYNHHYHQLWWLPACLPTYLPTNQPLLPFYSCLLSPLLEIEPGLPQNQDVDGSTFRLRVTDPLVTSLYWLMISGWIMPQSWKRNRSECQVTSCTSLLTSGKQQQQYVFPAALPFLHHQQQYIYCPYHYCYSQPPSCYTIWPLF